MILNQWVSNCLTRVLYQSKKWNHALLVVLPQRLALSWQICLSKQFNFMINPLCSFHRTFWSFERTERSDRSDEIAFCSSIGGFAFFFNFLRTTSRHLQKIFSLNAYIFEPRRVSVQFFCRPRRKTRTKFFPKTLPKNFGQHGFFCRNILNFGCLPTAFKNVDALLLVTHWSNGFTSCLSNCPRL